MADPLSELTIVVAGAFVGFLYGLVGLGWGSIAFRTLLLTGMGPVQGLSTVLLSELLLDMCGKLYSMGKLGGKGPAKGAIFSGLKLTTTLVVSAATIGYLNTAYEKYLVAALNLLLAALLATHWRAGGGLSAPSPDSHSLSLGRGGLALNLYPRLAQGSRPLQLLTILPRILVLELFVPLQGASVLHAFLLTAPALPALFIARRVRGRIGEGMLGRLAAIALTLNMLTGVAI